MHIIGILIAIASLIYWVSRAARGVGDIADAANTMANLPRKRRFQKKYHTSGFDLVETPVEAAAVLMISTARMSEEKRVTDSAKLEITRQLQLNMQMSGEDADGIYRQMHSLIYDIVLPESSLFPMLNILKETVDRSDAEDLAQMMETTASTDGAANTEQTEFIRRFRERMGLLN